MTCLHYTLFSSRLFPDTFLTFQQVRRSGVEMGQKANMVVRLYYLFPSLVFCLRHFLLIQLLSLTTTVEVENLLVSDAVTLQETHFMQLNPALTDPLLMEIRL